MRKSMCLLLVLLLLTSCGIANKETSPSPQDKQSAKALSSQGNREVRSLSNDGNMAPYAEAGQTSGGKGKAMLHSRIILNSWPKEFQASTVPTVS